LSAHRLTGTFPPVPPHTLVIVSDAHLGYAPPEAEAAMLEFLERVPDFGDGLLVNGDLFEFWFAYRRVIPREGFRVAAALERLARRVPVTVVGGNHDRWGRGFWVEELGVRFAPDQMELAVGDRRVLALHGDGIPGTSGARLLHRLVRLPITSALYGLVHPDLAVPMVRWIAARLGTHGVDGPMFDQEAVAQQSWAAARLGRDPGLGLLVMGHTHRPALVEVAPGQAYVNPGAWFDGFRYAVATAARCELRRFTPATRPPRLPTAPR
jgi:UDP-2,3-diacylglucosamine hydrolase